MGATEPDSRSGNVISIFEEATESGQYSRDSMPDKSMETPEFCESALKAIKQIIANGMADRCIFHFLQLSMRTQGVLQNHSIVTFDVLTKKTREDLLALPRFSRIMAREVEQELQNWGLKLADSLPDRRRRRA